MIKPEDIMKVEFSRSLFGYDMKEVDTLLDAVIEQMEAWERERGEMLTALECLLQELEQSAPQAAETEKHRISAQESAHRIAQGHTAQVQTDLDVVSAMRGRKRTKTSDMHPKMQPLPQAVSVDTVEPMQEIPLVKMPISSAESEFEIPTYLFETDTEPVINMPAVAEEVEIDSAIPLEQKATAMTEDLMMQSEATPVEQTEQEA